MRAAITRYTENESYFEAEVDPRRGDARHRGRDRGACALGRVPVRELREAQQEDLPRGARHRGQIEDYSKLADTIASHLAIKIAEKQQLLEVTTISERLERVFTLMESEISVLRSRRRSGARVKRQMEKTQREYYLNEQMKAIQKELGDSEEGRDDLAEIEQKIEKTKLSRRPARRLSAS